METTCNVNEKIDAPVEEAYKVLRTNIQFYGIDYKIRTIAITSCNPGEGKTTTSINLSISMAKSGMSVLLIDADLRKSSLNKHLGSKNTIGLSNYLSGSASFDQILNMTNIENFYYISCGQRPPNPAELIGSSAFSKLLNLAEEKFDIVIIDTPPLGSVIDCAVISAQTDGTIIVIQAKSVAYKYVQRVKEQLEKVGARILGVVLNKVDKSDYGYYYNYYNYYGNEKKTRRGWFKQPKKSEL